MSEVIVDTGLMENTNACILPTNGDVAHDNPNTHVCRRGLRRTDHCTGLHQVNPRLLLLGHAAIAAVYILVFIGIINFFFTLEIEVATVVVAVAAMWM